MLKNKKDFIKIKKTKNISKDIKKFIIGTPQEMIIKRALFIEIFFIM